MAGILALPVMVFADEKVSVELDRELAAKLDSTGRPSVMGNVIFKIDPHKHSFNLSEESGQEVYINEQGQLALKEYKYKESTPVSRLKEECAKLKHEDSSLPSNAYLICDRGEHYLMAVYEVEGEDMVRIVGRKKDEKEFKTIKEIKGKHIVPVKTHSRDGWGDFDRSFAFSVSGDSLDEQGVYLAIIKPWTGTITEYEHPFSLKARPVLDSSQGSLFFVGLDQNIYELDFHDRDESGRTLVWLNEEGLMVEEIGVANTHSFVRLRGYGSDIYKFFSEGFTCEIDSASDIVEFEYLDSSKIINEDKSLLADKNIGTVALVIKDNGHTPPQAYLRRWYINQANHLFSVKSMSTEDSSIKRIGIFKSAIEELEASGFDRKTICKIYAQFDEDFQRTMSQSVLLEYLSKDYENVKFVKPYSMTIENTKDGTRIPVNVWPAHGASAANPRPLIVHVHGGPNMHDDINFNVNKQYLASQGFWVVCPEARGSTGYGDAHEKALVDNWGQGHIDDIIAVAESFKGNSAVDCSSVFLMGHSFGGYSTMAAATRADVANYFDGYVSICGVSEAGQAFKESTLGESKADAAKALNSWEVRSGFKAYQNHSINAKNIKISPFYSVQNVKKPLLLIHGTNDTAVYPNQSEDFFWRSKDAGKKVHTVLIEGDGHDVGFYGYADLPLKFFNQIMAEGYSSLSSDSPYRTDDVKRLIDETF